MLGCCVNLVVVSFPACLVSHNLFGTTSAHVQELSMVESLRFNSKTNRFFLILSPGTSPIGRAAEFYAICPYRCVRSSDMEPIQVPEWN